MDSSPLQWSFCDKALPNFYWENYNAGTVVKLPQEDTASMKVPTSSLYLKPLALGVLWMAFLLTACSTPTPTAEPAPDVPTQPLATQTPTNTSTLIPTETASITPSPSATATLTPTATETPSPTPTPEPLIAVILEDNTNIFDGPGNNYNYLATYSKDLKFQVVGRSADENWLVVLLPGEIEGWVELEKVQFEKDVQTLFPYEIPPTPYPTITPLPVPAIVFHKGCPWCGTGSIWNDYGLFFEFFNFRPNEFVNLDVVAEDGTIIATWRGRASDDGYGGGAIKKSEFPITGTYTFNLYGAEGSFAQSTYFYITSAGKDE